VDEVPALDISIPAGIPMNLEPAVLFENPVGVVLPVVGASVSDSNGDGVLDRGLEGYEIYQYTGNPSALWRSRVEAAGWMVEGSRVDRYDSDPPGIEFQVNHFCAVQAGIDACFSPGVDVKVNGKDSALTLSQSSQALVTISVVPCEREGLRGDWWIMAETPDGPYSFVRGRGWEKGILLSAQAPFEYRQNLEIYSGPPPFGLGDYTVHFIADDKADGRLGANAWTDTVEVSVR
jgi:hypothetical protein